MHAINEAVRQTAWNSIGHNVEGMTPQGARQKAFDWEPVEHSLIDGVTFEVVESSRRQVRSDNGFELGITGKGYGTIGNNDLAQVAEATGLDPVLAGDWKGGRIVWMLLDMGEKAFGGGESLKRYLWIANGHGGAGSFSVVPTNIRPFCANQLPALRREKAEISIRHTRNAMDYVHAATESLRRAVHEFDAVDQAIERLLATEFTRKQFFEDMVPAILGDKPEWEQTKTGTGGAKRTNWHKRWEELVETYASPTQDGIRNTAYGAVMAVNEWEQHVRGGRGSQSEVAVNRTLAGLPASRKALAVIGS